MTNWNEYWRYLIPFVSLFGLLLVAQLPAAKAQSVQKQYYLNQLNPPARNLNYSSAADTVDYFPKYPDPTSVMFKSLMLPGWGQVVNGQIWKVPIVYALLGGLTYYTIYLTKRYHDYRAAYYNLNDQAPDDFRFGPTPDYISENASLSFLKQKRNKLHNRRDLSYMYVALAYALNVIDAYVFAHLKSFNVSKDLSMNAKLAPNVVAHRAPGFTLSIQLY